MTGVHVKANYDKTERGWYRDRHARADMERRVRALRREGYSMAEIAVRTGITDRSVFRLLHRVERSECGVLRTQRRGPCTILVDAGERCIWHR